MALQHSNEGWTCPECGRLHTGLVTCFGPDEPLAWHQAPFRARLLGRLSRSFCQVKTHGQQCFYVRGHLPIPLTGHDELWFSWNVWVEVSQPDFHRLTHPLEEPHRITAPPVGGNLETPLPYPTPTSGMPVELHNQPPGQVPHVLLTRAAGHPLQTEQETGIDTHRLAQINNEILGPASPQAKS